MMRAAVWWIGVMTGLMLAAGPVRADSWPTDKQYADIQTAFLREDFERVIKLIKPANAAGSLEPRTTQVWLWYVLSLDRLQRSDDALQEIDRLHTFIARAAPIEQARLWPETLFWEGEISRRALKIVRARLAYQKLLTQFPDSPWRTQAHRGLGLILFEQRMYDEAIRQFDEAAARSSERSSLRCEAKLLAGLCEVRRGRFQEALTRIQQLLIEEPDLDAEFRARALFYVAESLTGLRWFPDAVQAYHRAIDADPESRWARLSQFGLGWSYFQQHECQKSLDAFARYAGPGAAGSADLSKDETGASVEMLFAQGRCAAELGDEATALARFQALRAYDPEHDLAIEAGLSIAEILERQQRVAEADVVLDSVFRQAFDPAQIQRAHLRLGSIRLMDGEVIKATAEFLLARESANRVIRQAALNGLGDAYGLLNNAAEAERFFNESLAISPANAAGLYAAYQLGRLKLDAGRVDDAIALFQRVVDDAAASSATGDANARALSGEARLALAFTYLSNDQPGVARSQLEALRAQDPASPHAARAGYYLALLAARDEKTKDAVALCWEVIRRAPQSDEALEAHLLLADLVASESSPDEALTELVRSLGSLDGMTRQHLGRLGKKVGDLARQAQRFNEAIRWYDVAWEAWPILRGELDYRIASCYEEARDVEAAVNRYRAITQSPWDIRGQLAAARLLEREQRWNEAMTIYEFVAGQSVPEAKIARERLSERINHGDSSRSVLQ